MSRGPFVERRYECSELGRRMRIRIQPETALFSLAGFGANNQPPGPVNLPLRANVSMRPSGLGVRPRCLVVVFPDTGAIPAGYSRGERLVIPILRPGLWNAAEPGTSMGVYLGRPVRVVGKLPEIVR